MQWPRWLLSSSSILWMSTFTTPALAKRQLPCFLRSHGHSVRPPQWRRLSLSGHKENGPSQGDTRLRPVTVDERVECGSRHDCQCAVLTIVPVSFSGRLHLTFSLDPLRPFAGCDSQKPRSVFAPRAGFFIVLIFKSRVWTVLDRRLVNC